MKNKKNKNSDFIVNSFNKDNIFVDVYSTKKK